MTSVDFNSDSFFNKDELLLNSRFVHTNQIVKFTIVELFKYSLAISFCTSFVLVSVFAPLFDLPSFVLLPAVHASLATELLVCRRSTNYVKLSPEAIRSSTFHHEGYTCRTVRIHAPNNQRDFPFIHIALAPLFYL